MPSLVVSDINEPHLPGLVQELVAFLPNSQKCLGMLRSWRDGWTGVSGQFWRSEDGKLTGMLLYNRRGISVWYTNQETADQIRPKIVARPLPIEASSLLFAKSLGYSEFHDCFLHHLTYDVWKKHYAEAEEGIQQRIKEGEFIIRPLNAQSQKEVDIVQTYWPYSDPGCSYVQRRMEHPTAGIFVKTETGEEPVTWILTHEDQTVGMLHTMQEHRQKSYAKIALLEIAKECFKDEENKKLGVFCHTLKDNGGSQRILKSIGFEIKDEVAWAAM